MCVAYNNLVTDVHDATSEDRSETVQHDSQGGLARKERVLLGSPLPSCKKEEERIYRANTSGCNPIKVHIWKSQLANAKQTTIKITGQHKCSSI